VKKPAKKAVKANVGKVSGMRNQSRGLPQVRGDARDVAKLLERVVSIVDAARTQVVRSVNSTMVLAYWQIGRELVEHYQGGALRAEYGDELLNMLSQRLQERVGRGYSTTNLRYFRTFYLAYADRTPQIRHIEGGKFSAMPAAVSKGKGKNIRHIGSGVLQVLERATEQPPDLDGFSQALGWSHYRLLMNVEHKAERRFYEIEAERGGWPVQHLERQIHTHLFARLLKSRDKEGVLDLARRGQVIERPIDAIKHPFVLDFLDLPENEKLRESDLESAILEKLQRFLLELGKGFAFVARQRRISFEDEHFYVDLVFYNVILKCYLLIDLKLGKLAHQDVGQMDSYVRIFDAMGRTEGDGPTIGLILCAQKNDAVARYSILHEHEQLFAAKYVTYLPSVEELQSELARERRLLDGSNAIDVTAGKRRTRPIHRRRTERRKDPKQR
jgi:predicted nuclease of restriction endonuclease-like (RecB) superfamily